MPSAAFAEGAPDAVGPLVAGAIQILGGEGKAGRKQLKRAALAKPGTPGVELAVGAAALLSGRRVEAERVFPDHHPFRATDLRHLEDDATLWVTTEKDALKIDPAWIRRGSLLVLSIDIAFEDEAAFRDWLLGRIDRLARS